MPLLVPLVDVELAIAGERRRQYAERAKADGTWKVYAGHWRRFEKFCRQTGALAGPPTAPSVLADWIIHMSEAGLAGSTISVGTSAVAHRNRLESAPSPLEHSQVQEVLTGARRIAARAQAGRGASEPLLPSDLRKMIAVLRPGLVGQRDMALLTFGFAGGFRREELCRLTLENLTFEVDSIIVHLPWGKSDQLGEGHRRRICLGDSIELCPVRNLKLWLAASGLTSGFLFRPIIYGKHVRTRPLSPRRIDQIVREYTRRVIENDPSAMRGRKYSAHSLRSGLCTSAALAGKPEHQIRDHVGHRSAQTTAKYIRGAHIRSSTLTKGIGL